LALTYQERAPSRWLADMALKVLRSGAQCLYIRLGDDSVDERLDDHA
jgi:hypothetical protein